MTKYRSKPVEIKAHRWEKDAKLPVWLRTLIQDREILVDPTATGFPSCVLMLGCGPIHVAPGDWIIKGPTGDLGWCNDADFQAMFEAI